MVVSPAEVVVEVGVVGAAQLQWGKATEAQHRGGEYELQWT